MKKLTKQKFTESPVGGPIKEGEKCQSTDKPIITLSQNENTPKKEIKNNG